MSGKYEQHEFGKIIPKMLSKQYADLQESIEKQGVLVPITLYDGKVLEGWNRYSIVQDIIEAGGKLPGTVPYTTFKGNEVEALEYVMGTNLNRRHITEDKRAALVLNFRKKLEKLAPEKSEDEIDEATAKHTETSKRTVQRVKAVDKKASPEVKEALEKGEITPATAEKLTKADPAKVAKALEKAKKEKKATKATVAEATGVKDLAGRKVPKHLLAEFEGGDEIEQAHAELKSAMKRLNKQKDTYPQCFTQAIVKNLESVMAVLDSEKAAWVCKACSGEGETTDGKQCNVCKGKGYHAYASGKEPKY